MTFGESLIETRSVMKRGMLERVMLLTHVTGCDVSG